jgi:hypothetical protein
MITESNADVLMEEMYTGFYSDRVSPTMEEALTFLLRLRDVSLRETIFQRMFANATVTTEHVERFIPMA